MANFINPYNFVPLKEKKSIQKKEEQNYTGVIHYQLHTRTPLFIPNTSSEHAFREYVGNNVFPNIQQDKNKTEERECKSYDFYSYTDLSCMEAENAEISNVPCHNPVIPGSEVRGMFRNIYEILTNSCLSSIDLDSTLSKRTAQTFSPGLLKKETNGKFRLFKAEDCIFRKKNSNKEWEMAYCTDKIVEGQKVWFIKKDRKNKKGQPIKPLVEEYDINQTNPRMIAGYVIKGEDSPKGRNEKHSLHIFKRLNGEVKGILDVGILDSVLEFYSAYSDGTAYKEYIQQWRQFKEENKEADTFFPVYYNQCSGNGESEIFLAPACFTREVYKNTIRDMIYDYQPCNKKNMLCPACSLFGMMNQEVNHASRVRFSDLTLEKEDCKKEKKDLYDKIVTLKELASPKISNIEFYLKRPEAFGYFWTYDYYIEGGVDENRQVRLYTPTINGRKFYWHNMNPDYICKGEISKRNVTIRPLKSGVTFTGNLYFQNLSENELQKLIYILNAGEDQRLKWEERKHGYKLGHGKPLGLGSVSCRVTGVELRTVSSEYRIQIKKDSYTKEIDSSLLFEQGILEEFSKFTQFNLLDGKKISYPYKGKSSSEEAKIYEWFTWNHASINKKNIETDKMPNKRINMVYQEYMEAMNPELRSIKDS